jgi:DNA polymerase III epsilon subunit-like protein
MIIFDLETTGFSPKKEDIIEVSALKFRGLKFQEEFQQLLQPSKPLPSIIKQLTGLLDEDLAYCPTFSDISRSLFKFMKGHRIIGYNVSFDKSFLVANDPVFDCLEYQDYLKYVKGLDYELPNYKMRTVAEYMGIRIHPIHRAYEDTRTLFELIKRLGV